MITPTTRSTQAIPALVLVLLVLALVATTGGCGSTEEDGFAIYLTAGFVPASRLATLSHIDIADTPLVSGDDIVAYYEDSHRIELTPAAYLRIVDLPVPTDGLSFVVCVDRQPVYVGAFYVSISSSSFPGVVIMKPLSPADPAASPAIEITLGYPSSEWFSGADPRADETVLAALKEAGKLR